MKIKTFQAASLQEAFERIKAELGANALILSSKEIPAPAGLAGQTRRQFEVVAAMEEPEELSAAPAAPPAVKEIGIPLAPPPPAATTGIPVRGPSPARSAASSPAGRPSRPGMLQDEINQLKKMVYFLSQRISPEREIPVGHPFFDIYQELLTAEVDPWLAFKLVDEAMPGLDAGNNPAALVRERMAHCLELAPPEDRRRYCAVFVGPTGVGKTTTIAKLAARHSMELQRKVLLLTMDTFRIAAVEQLKTYAEIMGIPCRTVTSPAQLKTELDRSGAFDTVLIDTVGKGQRDLAELEPWANFISAEPRLRRNLVLSATSKMADLLEIVERFGVFGLDRICITKIDETLSLGPVFNVLARSRLPVDCLTNGQNVPRDLIIPGKSELVEILLRNQVMEGVA